MTWSVVGASGIAGGNNTTAQFTAPAVVNADDLFLLAVDYNPATYTPPTPTGWTAGPTVTTSSTMETKVFWKWADGTEDATTQGWTGAQWTTTARKGIAWACIRGVLKTVWNAMSDTDRFASSTALSTATETVPALTTSTTYGFGHISMWNERSSTNTTSGTLAAPSGYTLASGITFTTGGGVCQGAVAWPTSIPEETDGSVGAGSWGNAAAGGISLITVGLPSFLAVVTVSGGLSSITTTALAGTVDARRAATLVGGVCSITLAALPGAVVSGGAVTVSGGVCAITTTALAGSVITPSPATVVGKVATATLAAPRGTPGPVSADVAGSLSYPAIAAHRGGGGVKPQNTMTAFTYAAGLSDAVAEEMDIQVNASGSLVIWHDDDVSAVGVNSSGVAQTGLVTSKTDSDWNALCVKWPAGFTGPPPAAASYWREVVAAFRNTGRVLLPEIKATAAGAPLVASIVANGMQGQCIVQSFDAADLTQVVAAGIEALLLDDTPNFTTMAAAGIGHVGIDSTVVTGTQVTNAHAAGIKVWCYTPNTTSARDSLLAIGVDGFITNKPATLLPNFVDGETAAITLTALAGSVDARRAATVAGGVSAVTVTALAGSVATGVTVAGATATLTTTALAGTVDAQRAVTLAGGTATITATAQPGAVVAAGAVTVSGLPGTITVTALPGTVDAARVATVAGGTAQVTLTAQPGVVGAGTTITGATATLTLTAPGGQVVATRAATIAGLTAQVQLEAHAGFLDIETGLPVGRILASHLRVPASRGELRIPQAHGHLTTPTARGTLR